MELDHENKEFFKHYLSMVLGFVQSVKEEEVCAAVCTSTRAVSWDTITKEFITLSMISGNFATSYVTVPVSSLVKPMCVYGDYGGMKNKYFCALPKGNWARYFGDKLEQSPPDNNVTFEKNGGS